MGKYVDILDKGFRADATIYAESIPHLLHWDLAYLWVLERESHRPAQWGEQISAWRYLVALLLTDQLDIESELIREPFLSLTKPYGIDEVHWLKLKHGGDCVGVLSPTVLARPLPDYNQGDLQRWERKLPHPEQNNRDVLAHFVKLAIQHLDQLRQEGRSESPIIPKLARILEREFEGAKEMSAPPEGDFKTIYILKRISWVQEKYEPCIEPIDFLVGWQSDQPVAGVYIPRCEHCAALLTRPQSAAPIEIQNEGEPFTLECNSPACGRLNELSLQQFLIWVRDREVVVWNRQGIFPVPAKGFPPSPTITEREIQFEWRAAQLPGAERTNRFLRFRFPDNKHLTQRNISEIFYHKLLAPGKLDAFTGLPFKLEWREAIENFADVRAEPDPIGERVAYSQIKARGLPEPIKWSYGSLSLKKAPELGVGAYPNPHAVPKKWKWYRLFLHGQDRRQYRLEAPETKEILPWLVESGSGYPQSFAIHSSDASVSYSGKPEHSASFSSTSEVRLHLGVDFGTTNTVIYFLLPDEGQADFDHVLRSPQKYCVEPPHFADIVQWLAPTMNLSSEPIGDCLPGVDYGKKGAARFIIPTVLWEMNDNHLICWNPDGSPIPQAHVRGDFKLQRGAEALRRAFLRESLLLTLPWVLKLNLDKGALRSDNLTVAMGFAFPLAMSGPVREEMNKTFSQLRETLKDLTGLKYDSPTAVSESSACKDLLGAAVTTQTFLVADMGGGTIDLALFTGRNADPDQIGSVQFAGEKFLRVLSNRKQIEQLKLGDSIRQGNIIGGNDQTANATLRQFIGMAFEFLRTMIAAYRRQKPDQEINLVLVGNGWHLVEVFNADAASYTGRQLFNKYYSHLIESLGDSKLKLADPLHELPSSKHMVAIGALKHAVAQLGSQLNPNTYAPSKLPAGRRLIFTIPAGEQNTERKIEWFDLVGEKVSFPISTPEALKELNLSIDFTQMAPLEDPWRTYLLNAVFGVKQEQDIPYPNEMQLRQQIHYAIPMGHVPMLGKGPLQLILENKWAEWLER